MPSCRKPCVTKLSKAVIHRHRARLARRLADEGLKLPDIVAVLKCFETREARRLVAHGAKLERGRDWRVKTLAEAAWKPLPSEVAARPANFLSRD